MLPLGPTHVHELSSCNNIGAYTTHYILNATRYSTKFEQKCSNEQFKRIVVAAGIQSHDFRVRVVWKELNVIDEQGNKIKIDVSIQRKICDLKRRHQRGNNMGTGSAHPVKQDSTSLLACTPAEELHYDGKYHLLVVFHIGGGGSGNCEIIGIL